MNSATTRPSTAGGFTVLKSGGTAPTLLQRLSGFMTWKVAAILVVTLLFLFLAYSFYAANTKSAFHANRENVPPESSKTARLMLFYVDWCPHCKTAKPEWDALKAEYDGKVVNGYTVEFDEYDCTNSTDEVTQLMDKYGIEGYPTIKLLKDNQVVEYDAKPTKSTMEQFLNTVL